MARPRSYSEAEVLGAAKDLFWEKGYVGSGIADLEERTGLNRSSLYLAFGTKRALFDGALAGYLDGFVDPRLSRMEADGAGLEQIGGFFADLASLFRDEPAKARRGCLMVNTIAELASRDADATQVSEAFRNRLRAAFHNALNGAASTGQVDPRSIPTRAHLLVAGTLGVWLAVRIDPNDAAAICDALVDEVRAWRQS